MAAIDRSIYERFDIISADGTNTVDLRGGVVTFSYFENLFSPMITSQVLVANTGNTVSGEKGEIQSIYNGLPLRGGEIVNIKIQSNSENNIPLEFSQNNGNELYVASITNVLIDAGREAFTLNLVSREAITNETSRVGKKFPSSQSISDSVKDIVKEYLLSEKDIFVDKTENPYGFIGNLKKPFTILTWLASKSVPANVAGQSSTAGYFFFENADGFHFKSIDSLFAQEHVKSYIYGGQPTSSIAYDGEIVNLEADNRFVANQKLRMGVYKTKMIVFDPFNCKYDIVEQDAFDTEDGTTLAGKELPVINNKFLIFIF